MIKRIKKYLKIRGPIGFFVFGVYRFGNIVYYKIRIPIIRQLLFFLYRVLDIIVVRIIGKAAIPPQTRIGKYCGLVHDGNGVVISPYAIIGDRVTIFHQVTIGNNKGAPKIENNVHIYTGAKVFGNITVGEGSIIGANAVVNRDVPKNSIAVGVPARIIPKEKIAE